MKNREEIITRLREYYEENGIIPDERFDCPNKNKCNSKSIPLAQGMQCHVGKKFGELKISALVVSLDCGWGGALNIEERTKEVENVGNNPHMRGTIKCISNLLFNNDENKECLQYYAMTNSCKCTRQNSADQLPDFFYEQCILHKIKEIEILDPDVIYFQGKRALFGLDFLDIDSQTDGMFEYLKGLRINGRIIYVVKCIHPSARGRHAQKRKLFYNQTLPMINDFLKHKLN